MPVAAQRDPEETRQKLAAWLAPKVGAKAVELSALGGPAFSGFSNETLLVDASWDDDGEQRARSFAVRVEPGRHQVFPDTAFETQIRVIRTLAERTNVAVPTIVWYEPDASVLGGRFFVMERVVGRVPPDNPPYHVAGWVHDDATPAVRERIWWSGLDAMVGVHKVDWRAAGLDFLDVVDAAGQLKRDRDYLAWVCGDRRYPLVEEAFDLLESRLPREEPAPALCWGDSRIGNVIFDDDGNALAVLDWEMVLIGNPVADLSWFMLLDRHHSDACDMPRLEGFPSREETVARWEQATGRSADAFGWYFAIGAARYAAILTRIMDLLEDTGLIPGARAMAFDNTGTKLLRLVLEDGKV